MSDSSRIAENIQQIRQKISAMGRPDVQIVGVAKGQPIERLREGVGAGITTLANNYVQEGIVAREALKDLAVVWHFIGHIQSRKTKDLLDYDGIQSLDRLEVAQSLDRRLETVDRKLRVLVEVNLGDESTKSGIRTQDLGKFLEEVSKLPHLNVRGLMSLPPPLQPIEKRRPYFRELHRLFEKFRGPSWDSLSMGTSDDYAIAAEEGATMVRLGTALFGRRDSIN